MVSTYELWRRYWCKVGLVLVGLCCVVVVLFHVNSTPADKLRSSPLFQAILAGQRYSMNKRDLLEATEDNFVGLDQEDPALVSFVRRQLVPPSSLPYNLSQPHNVHFSQFRQSEIANSNFLNGMDNGVFVEAGAYDGESLSNTLYFEKYRGWTGLLIEPDSKLFPAIVARHRQAYSINAGFSFTTKADILKFKPEGYLGRMAEEGKEKDNKLVMVKVFPIYTLLRALDYSLVDFFSLDIEGDEMKVLRTIPWDKVRFRLMCIEINHVPRGTKGVIRFLEAQGYLFLGMKKIDAWFGLRELLLETMDVEAYLKKNKIWEQRRSILINSSL